MCKIRKQLFEILDIRCLTFLYFVWHRICVFVFLSFCHFVLFALCSSTWSTLTGERLSSDSRPCVVKSIVIDISNEYKWWHRIPGNGTEFPEKWQSLQKKVSLTPKKVKMRCQQKSLSPIQSGHEPFAKKRIKIGLIWPLQLHFWSTDAYRGFPLCAIFPIPDTNQYSIVLC